MITTSRHNTFGCWIFYLLTFLWVPFIFGMLLNHFSNIRLSYFDKLENDNLYESILIFSLPVIFFGTLVACYIKKVVINTETRQISFKNIITRKTKIYDFTHFDGYIDTDLRHRYASYKTIGLVKDKKAVRYIDSFWVSNYDEIHNALVNLNYIGSFRFGTWKQLKLLMRKPIIDN